MAMTQEDANRLRIGIYRIFWVGEKVETSLAAIGRSHEGLAWFCPADWFYGTPCYGWDRIDRVVLIASDEHPTQKKCRAVLCFEGGAWRYETIVCDLHGVKDKDLEDEIMKEFFGRFGAARRLDRVFVLSHEDVKQTPEERTSQ